MADRVLQPDLSYEELRRQAFETDPVFREGVQSTVDDLIASNPEAFSGIEFKAADVKSETSTLDKIERKYPAEGGHRYVQDMVRGSIYVDTPEQIQQLRERLAENFDIIEEDNRFLRPNEQGFRDINMKIRMPNGHIVELQIQHRGMEAANKLTHELYEEKRELDKIARNRDLTDAEMTRRAELVEEMRDIHGRAASQAGLDELLDPAVRPTFERSVRPVVPEVRTPVIDSVGGGTSFAMDLARGFSKCAKILGPIGVVAAGIEVALLGDEAKAAVDSGLITNEALAEYGAVLTAHASQMTFDPTLVGGEVAIQEWYDDFAKRHGLSPELTEALRPSSLLRDIAGSVQMSAEQQLFCRVYDALPDEVTDGMSPETQTLVQLKQHVEAANEALDRSRMIFPVDMIAKQEAEKKLVEAENRFLQQYDEYAQSGALQEHVMVELDVKAPEGITGTQQVAEISLQVAQPDETRPVAQLSALG